MGAFNNVPMLLSGPARTASPVVWSRPVPTSTGSCHKCTEVHEVRGDVTGWEGAHPPRHNDSSRPIIMTGDSTTG